MKTKIAISRGALYDGPASETVRVIVILEVGSIVSYTLAVFQSSSTEACTHATLQNAMVYRGLHVAALQR
jgi:hypothetical protein